jgi:hypothetical protein
MKTITVGKNYHLKTSHKPFVELEANKLFPTKLILKRDKIITTFRQALLRSMGTEEEIITTTKNSMKDKGPFKQIEGLIIKKLIIEKFNKEKLSSRVTRT